MEAFSELPVPFFFFFCLLSLRSETWSVEFHHTTYNLLNYYQFVTKPDILEILKLLPVDILYNYFFEQVLSIH